MTPSFDASKIRDNAWILYEVTPEYRRYRCPIGDGNFAIKTEYLGQDLLIRKNQEDFHDSIGRRWGDGKIVARVPMNVLYNSKNQFVEKSQKGDREFMKWWLNSEAARPYRCFKGVV